MNKNNKNTCNPEYPVHFWERGGYYDLAMIVAAIFVLALRLGV